MTSPILRITDGTDIVNLLDLKGWLLQDWNPAVPEPKGGGVFRSSPLTNGRKLAYRKMDNITDTFNMVASGGSQDTLIGSIQKLQRLLEKALSYWTSDWQGEPVWIEAKGPCEENVRYATISDYRLNGFGSPYKQPFFNSQPASEVLLTVEHMFWQETKPGDAGHCVELSNIISVPSISNNSASFYPDSSASDATYGEWGTIDLTSHELTVSGPISSGRHQAGIIFKNVNIPIGATIKSATLNTTSSAFVIMGEAEWKVEGQSQAGGGIDSVTLVDGGHDYKSPVVQISSPGSGAVIHAEVTGGVITSLSIVSAGHGYVNPVLTIRDIAGVFPNDGYGASATATAGGVGISAAEFSTASDFINRPRTSSYSTSFMYDGNYASSIDVTNIVKEIVSSQYWVSGDNIGLFISDIYYGGMGAPSRTMYSFDEGVNYPSLSIDWSASTVSLGRDTTCAQEVYVSNKTSAFHVNYIYWVDTADIIHGGSTWSSNIYEASFTSPIPLFPYDINHPTILPAIGDFFYAGSCEVGMFDSSYGPFSNLVFDLSSAAAGVSGIWQYYNAGGLDGGWASIDPNDYTIGQMCGEDMMITEPGVGSIIWTAPSDWVTTTINGHLGYWIRYKITSISGTPAPPYQQHRNIYTVTQPFVDIDASQVPGDIPALARIMFDSSACYYRPVSSLVLGLRSLERGEDFNAYLNASYWGSPPGLNFGFNTAIPIHYVQRSDAPALICLDLTDYNPNALGITSLYEVANWSIYSNLAWQYIGTYHAHLRCRVSAAGAIGRVNFRLRAEFGTGGNVSYSDVGTVNTASGDIGVIDLGQLSIFPSLNFGPHDLTDNMVSPLTISVETYGSVDDDYHGMYIYDMILIPADEWSGNFGSYGHPLIYEGGVDIDAIRKPKNYTAFQFDHTDSHPLPSDYHRWFVSEWSRIASGEPMFQANKDQRLWFFQYLNSASTPSKKSFFEVCGRVCLQRSSRYILMRGTE